MESFRQTNIKHYIYIFVETSKTVRYGRADRFIGLWVFPAFKKDHIFLKSN